MSTSGLRPARPVSVSRHETSEIMMPQHANNLGHVFGGVVLAMMDSTAAIAAIRHARINMVTASIDRVDFRERIPVGALVTCAATVDFVGNTSMDISVEVYSEQVSTGERRHTHTAHVVFVAIDEHGKPKRVPRLVPESADERERYSRAEAHRQRQKRA